jgi:hypothetical protein
VDHRTAQPAGRSAGIEQSYQKGHLGLAHHPNSIRAPILQYSEQLVLFFTKVGKNSLEAGF